MTYLLRYISQRHFFSFPMGVCIDYLILETRIKFVGSYVEITYW